MLKTAVGLVVGITSLSLIGCTAIDGADKAIVNINDHKLRLVVAADDESRQRGLSNRDDIPYDGMLFTVDEPRVTTMWMKDTRVALDVIWAFEGKIVFIEKNVQPPRPDSKLIKYNGGNQTSDNVIEIAAGRTSELDIKVGDSIEIWY